MADKMMRIAGRGEDGKAKAINTDNYGDVRTVAGGSRLIMHNGTNEVSNGLPLDVKGCGMVLVNIYGTFDADISFLGGIRGVSGIAYASINGQKIDDGRVLRTTNMRGYYLIDCRGFEYVEVRVTRYTSGSITVVGSAESHTAELVEAPKKTKVMQSTGKIKGKETVVVIGEPQRVVEIESLEFATENPKTVFVFLEVEGERLSRILQRQGYNLQDLNAENLYLNESPLWKIEKYDDVEKSYKISLRKPIKTEGLLVLKVYNSSDKEEVFGVSCITKQI